MHCNAITVTCIFHMFINFTIITIVIKLPLTSWIPTECKTCVCLTRPQVDRTNDLIHVYITTEVLSTRKHKKSINS